MENTLYKMMMTNAAMYLRDIESKTHVPTDDGHLESTFTAFQISEVIALVTCQSKEQVINHIIDASKKL